MSSNRSWLETPLEDVCESIIDCVNKTAPSVDYTTPFKMIRTTNVRDGWVSLDNVKHVEEETYRKWIRRQKPEKGDVILTREAPLGEVGMLRSDEKVFLGQRLVSYRADPVKLDNRFLLYAFQGHFLQAQIKALGSGSTVEHMRVPDAKKLKILLPALSTQREVGAILSAYDDLIENNTRRIEILEEMARRLYEEWFVHFRFPGHEDVSFTDSELGRIPEGWEVVQLGNLVDEVKGAIPPSSVAPDTPYVGLEHIPRRSVTLKEWSTADTVESSKLPFKKGDILFGKIRPYFHKVSVAPVDGICSSDTILLRVKQSEHFGLALCCSSSDEFVAHATQTSNGTKMPRANWKVLSQYPLVLPSEDLLKTFNNFVSDLVSQCRTLVFKNNNLHAQRDLILPKLVSGEIDVSDISVPDDKEVEAA